MTRRTRDLELTEGRAGGLLLLAVVFLSAVLYVGVWLGQRGSTGASVSAAPVGVVGEAPAARSSWRLQDLPEGFIGPPPPPYPPPLAGAPGRGIVSGRRYHTVAVDTPGVPAEHARRRLLAEGFPAYVRRRTGIALRILVGDYATEAEARSVLEQLRQRGFEAQLSAAED